MTTSLAFFDMQQEQQMCWLQQLCAVLSTKLAQSRETPLAAALHPHQASNYRSLTSVALFFAAGIVPESQDRWMFRLARPAPPRGFVKVWCSGITGSTFAGNTLMAKHTLATNNLARHVGAHGAQQEGKQNND